MDVTLLIADADGPCRHALARFFAHCGFSVETVAGETECLDAIRAIRPHILLIDADVVRDSRELAALLASPSNLPDRPAVLVLGSAPADVLARRTGVPRARCFPKPLQILRLIDAVCPLVPLIESHATAGAEGESSLRPTEAITTC